MVDRYEDEQKSRRWESFTSLARKFGGDQSLKLIEAKGSMSCDRLYGLPWIVLALVETLKTVTHFSQQTSAELLELVCNFYVLSSNLMDAVTGFCLPEITAKFDRNKELLLKFCVRAGVGEIPISVHVFFHFPEIIAMYGAPVLYACYEEETDHKDPKSVIMNNSNRVMGASGVDYLQQVFVRKRRQDAIQYMDSQYPFKAESSAPMFALDERLLSHVDPSDERIENTICKKSINVAVKHLFPDLEILERDWWRDFEFVEYSVQVVDRHDNVAVYPERIQAWSGSGTLNALRVLALSPLKKPVYENSRKALFVSRKACFKENCFACSAIEYSSSNAVNSSILTMDQYYIPLGFRKHSEVFYCVAIPLVRRGAGLHGALHGVGVDSVKACTVDMRRFRDACNVAKVDGKVYYVVERFRGRLS